MPNSYLRTIERLTPRCHPGNIDYRSSYKSSKCLGGVVKCTVCGLVFRLTGEEVKELDEALQAQRLVQQYGPK